MMQDDMTAVSLDQAGIPSFKNGRPLSIEERGALAERKGLCALCGIRVRKVGLRQKKITNNDVYEGNCIRHAPTGKVPPNIVKEWERRTGKKSLFTQQSEANMSRQVIKGNNSNEDLRNVIGEGPLSSMSDRLGSSGEYSSSVAGRSLSTGLHASTGSKYSDFKNSRNEKTSMQSLLPRDLTHGRSRGDSMNHSRASSMDYSGHDSLSESTHHRSISEGGNRTNVGHYDRRMGTLGNRSLQNALDSASNFAGDSSRSSMDFSERSSNNTGGMHRYGDSATLPNLPEAVSAGTSSEDETPAIAPSSTKTDKEHMDTLDWTGGKSKHTVPMLVKSLETFRDKRKTTQRILHLVRNKCQEHDKSLVDAIKDVLMRRRDEPASVVLCLGALWKGCAVSEGIVREVADTGPLDLAFDIISTTQSNNVIQWGMGLLSCIGQAPEFKERIAMGIDMALDLLENHESNCAAGYNEPNPGVPEWIFRTIYTVLIYTEEDENMDEFDVEVIRRASSSLAISGSVGIMLPIMLRYIHEPSVQLWAHKTLLTLLNESTEMPRGQIFQLLAISEYIPLCGMVLERDDTPLEVFHCIAGVLCMMTEALEQDELVFDQLCTIIPAVVKQAINNEIETGLPLVAAMLLLNLYQCQRQDLVEALVNQGAHLTIINVAAACPSEYELASGMAWVLWYISSKENFSLDQDPMKHAIEYLAITVATSPEPTGLFICLSGLLTNLCSVDDFNATDVNVEKIVERYSAIEADEAKIIGAKALAALRRRNPEAAAAVNAAIGESGDENEEDRSSLDLVDRVFSDTTLLEEASIDTSEISSIPATAVQTIIFRLQDDFSGDDVVWKKGLATIQALVACRGLDLNLDGVVGSLAASLASEALPTTHAEACNALWALASQYPSEVRKDVRVIFSGLIFCLKRYRDGAFNGTVVLAALNATVAIVEALRDTNTLYENSEVETVVTEAYQILSYHGPEKAKISKQVLTCLYYFAVRDTLSIIRLGGVVAAIDILNNVRGDRGVDEVGCFLIARAAETDDLMITFSITQTDGIEVLLHISDQYSRDPIIVAAVLSALRHLCIDGEFVEFLASNTCIRVVAAALRDHPTDSRVIENALGLLVLLTVSPSISSAELEDFVGTVLDIANERSTTRLLKRRALAVIESMARKDRQLATAIISVGTATMLDKLEEFLGDEESLSATFSCLASLLEKTLVSNDELSDVVISAMLSDMDSEYVQIQASRSVALLAQTNADRLVQAGAIDALIFALWAHSNSQSVTGNVCEALAELVERASIVAASERDLDAVMGVMKRFKQVQNVNEKGCEALLSFARSPAYNSVCQQAGQDMRDFVEKVQVRFPDCAPLINDIVGSINR